MTSELGNRLASSELMPPPVPRPATRLRAPVVLEEDEWTEKIEAIVRRDFFPDVPKLESELEWLQARLNITYQILHKQEKKALDTERKALAGPAQRGPPGNAGGPGKYCAAAHGGAHANRRLTCNLCHSQLAAHAWPGHARHDAWA